MSSPVLTALLFAFRKYVVDGLPASGVANPSKDDIETFGRLLERALADAAGNLVSFETVALRDADASRADGQLAYVWNNNGEADDPANGIYQWADGEAEWVAANWYFETIARLAAPFVTPEAIALVEAAGAAQITNILQTSGGGLFINTYATTLPRGVLSGTVGGTAVTGATPGTYPLTAVGGSISGVTANLVVTSSTAASIVVTNPGLGSGTTPPTWANPAGATLPVGTTLTAVVGSLIADQEDYVALSADGLTLQAYRNNGGAVASLVGVAMPTAAAFTTLKARVDAVHGTGVTGAISNSGYNTLTQNGLLGFGVAESSVVSSSISQSLAFSVPPAKSATIFYIATGSGAAPRFYLFRSGTGSMTTTPIPIVRDGTIQRITVPNNHASLAATGYGMDSNGVSDTNMVRIILSGTLTETTPEITALLNSMMAIMELTRTADEGLRQRAIQIEGATSLIETEPNAIAQAAHDFDTSPFTSLTDCTAVAGVDSHGSAAWLIAKTTSGTARARVRIPVTTMGSPARVSTAFQVSEAEYDATGTVSGTIYQRNLAGTEISANIRYVLIIVAAGETITPAAPRVFHDAGRLLDVTTEQVEMEITITGASGRHVYVRQLLMAPGSNAAFRLPPPAFTTDELIAAAQAPLVTRITELETGQAKTQRAISGDRQAVPPGLAWEHATPYVFLNQSGGVETLFDRAAARALISDVAWNGVEVHVSPLGNNANSGLSAASPKRSLWAAIEVANAHAEAGAVVRVKGAGGQYHYVDSISGTGGVAPTKPMAFVCDDGVKIKHIAGASTTWPASFDATYTACVRFNRNAVHNIIATHLVDDHVPFRATQFPDNDMASVQATPGSWCTNTAAGDADTRNYYHPIDGVMPNNETTFVTRNYTAINLNACVTDLYFEDFDIYGGLINGDGSLNTSAAFDLDADAPDRVASLYGMGAYYPGNPATYPDMDCFAGRGSKLIAATKCVGVGAGKDVFNWHVRGSGAEPQGYMEIECVGRLAGVYGTGSSRQISTLHGHAKAITINPDYRFSENGEVITDIEDSRRWISGGVSEANADGGATPYGIKAANTSGTPSLWVQDHAIITPAGGRTLAAEPAKVHIKRVVSSGGADYVFGAGASIVDDSAIDGWS